MPEPLSPAAQAILAFMYEINMDFGGENSKLAAAALRALADAVVPEESAPALMRGHELERLCQRMQTRDQILSIIADILAITTELENHD